MFNERPGKLTKGVLFHQDNAPANKCVVAMTAMPDGGFELVDHPPYSSDMAPSDYFLFPDMRIKTLGWELSSIGPMMMSCLQLRSSFRESG